MNSFVSVPEKISQSWYRRPSLLYIKLVHTGASILTGYLYPSIFPVVSHLMLFTIGYTAIVSFWEPIREK